MWEEEVYVEAWARPDGLRHIHTSEAERECDPRLHVLPIPDHCWPSPPTYLPGTTTARLIGERVDADLVVHARVLALRRDGVWREVEGAPLT